MYVQARCSSGGGSSGWDGQTVYAQAFAAADGRSNRRVLVINKQLTPATVRVAGATGGTMLVVDQQSGEQPPRKVTLSSDDVPLAPFAVGVVFLG